MYYLIIVIVYGDETVIEDVDTAVDDVIPILFRCDGEVYIDDLVNKLYDRVVDRLYEEVDKLYSKSRREYFGKVRSLVLSVFDNLIKEQGLEIDLVDLYYRYIDVYPPDEDDNLLPSEEGE